MIRLFEAFSGYGSQALALEKYGVEFESVGIAEIDKYAIQAHKALHGEIKNYGDVSVLEVDELPDMDLFTYSFPCQDISNAGKQRGLEKGSGTRSSLLWECERIIEGKLPKFLMMENVKNLVGKKNKPHFDEWLYLLDELGYNNYWKVINAKWCGVPQNRERVFCVSIRKDVDNGLFNFYEDFDNGIRLKNILEEEVEEKYYLSEKMMNYVLNTGTGGFYYKPEIDLDIARPLTASMVKMHRAGTDNYISESFEKNGERTLLTIKKLLKKDIKKRIQVIVLTLNIQIQKHEEEELGNK
jgi:DNA-cytosine methyltransferase